jgi:hypothetical protein
MGHLRRAEVALDDVEEISDEKFSMSLFRMRIRALK